MKTIKLLNDLIMRLEYITFFKTEMVFDNYDQITIAKTLIHRIDR